MTTIPLPLTSNGVTLDSGSAAFGLLEDDRHLIGDVAALRDQMSVKGYLFLRGLLDRDDVLVAREEILLKFAIAGEIDSINYPVMDGVLSSETWIDKINLLAFTESLRKGLAYSRVVQAPVLMEFFERFLGGPARSFDFRWPRLMRVGEATGIHCDGPYISRGTRNLWSAWIPLGDVPIMNGPIMLLEGSHRNAALEESYLSKDADRDHLGWLSEDPNEIRRQLGGRWLSADFEPGDVLIFGMSVVHASLDNNSPQGHCRLSSDTRYQLASDPVDERYNGPCSDNPHGGPRRAFLPGKAPGNNEEFQDEWKPVDDKGRLLTSATSRPA